jgi:hypothetical protein
VSVSRRRIVCRTAGPESRSFAAEAASSEYPGEALSTDELVDLVLERIGDLSEVVRIGEQQWPRRPPRERR